MPGIVFQAQEKAETILVIPGLWAKIQDGPSESWRSCIPTGHTDVTTPATSVQTRNGFRIDNSRIGKSWRFEGRA